MALILFYTSLVLIITMLVIKYQGISFDHHEVISNIVCENDKHCHRIVHGSKKIVSKIRFENFHRAILIVTNFVSRKIILLKRKFDSKQPAFFLSPQTPTHTKRNAVSFFIKNVTDYKNSLRKKN